MDRTLAVSLWTHGDSHDDVHIINGQSWTWPLMAVEIGKAQRRAVAAVGTSWPGMGFETYATDDGG